MDARERREAVIGRAVAGPGHSDPASRRAAFDNSGVDERARRLVDKVARNAWTVTDEDVAQAKAAGLHEDAIFELVVCAALGQATRQLAAADAALDIATRGGSR
jgi:hypothetical protein